MGNGNDYNRNMKKNVPDPKLYNTLAPDMDYIYFENSDEFPFEYRADGYSSINAWWLAEASFLAYCHPGYCRMAYYIAGFKEFQFFNGPGTECMVASSDTTVIVSFRGTEINSRSVFYEVGTDLNTVPVSFPEGGKVHRGFLQALEEVWDNKGEKYHKKFPVHNSGLGSYLDSISKNHPERKIFICGHSLGGALATLCFVRVKSAKALYIYGAPRVGDADFVSLITGRDVFRIEHASDPVPLVPPETPKLNFSFKDTGMLYFISRDGDISNKKPVMERPDTFMEKYKKEKKLPDVKEQLQVWSSFFDTVHSDFVPRIEDHMPIYYAVKLWNNI